MPEPSIFSAFLVGLLGGAHCVGMCGGRVAALSFAASNDKPSLTMLLGDNGCRPFSYALAGAITGAVGARVRRIGSAIFRLI